MDGVESTNIINLAVASSSSRTSRRLRDHALVSLLGDSVAVNYEVSVRDASESYSSLSSQLATAVADGTFSTALRTQAGVTGAVGLQGAFSNSASTSNLLVTEPSGGGGSGGSGGSLDGGAVAGIVLAVLLIALGICAYCVFWGPLELYGSAPVAIEK